MPISKITGPFVIEGQNPSPTGTISGGTGNPDMGPSLAWGGVGFIDPRWGYFDAQPSMRAIGFAGGDCVTLDLQPLASAANNIVASQAASNAVPLTLVTTNQSATQVLAAPLVVFPSGTTIPKNTVVIETSPGFLTAGYNSAIQYYDPAKMLGRCVKVVSAGNDGSATFTVSGFDIYGYAMTERITGGSNATVTGKKAFKFVSSVIPATPSGSAVTVGTSDTIGFPLRDDKFGFLGIWFSNGAITSAGGWSSADTTSPATATTGDPRGTYALQSAADGAKQLQIIQMVSPTMINLYNSTGLFGVKPA